MGEALGGGGKISTAVLPQALIGDEGVRMLETSHEILSRGGYIIFIYLFTFNTFRGVKVYYNKIYAVN